MNEAKVRRELGRLLKGHGFWPIHFQDASICPKCRFEIRPPIGRPDIIAIRPDRTIVVEVKTFPRGKSFPLDAIRPEQRRWLDAWTEVGGLAYLGLGTTEGTAGSESNPRYCWLVPWSIWLGVEDVLSPFQASLPLLAGKGYSTALQEQHLDAIHLLAGWELRWSKGWHPQAATYEWQEVQ